MKVRIELIVDISEIEFEDVDIMVTHEKSEAWGQIAYTKTVEADWGSTKWNGYDCEVLDDDEARSYLVEQSEEGCW